MTAIRSGWPIVPRAWSRGCWWRRSPTRPAIPSRCSSSTCGSTPIWASTRSSGSRSSRRSRTGFPETPAAGPEEIGTLGTLREIVAFLGDEPCEAPRASCARRRSSVTGRSRRPIGSRGVAGSRGRENGVSHRDARARHAARRRPGHRLDQAGRDPLGGAGPAPELPSLKPEQLGTLCTLRQIVDVLSGQPAGPRPARCPAAGERNETASGPMRTRRTGSSARSPRQRTRNHAHNGNGTATRRPSSSVGAGLHPRASAVRTIARTCGFAPAERSGSRGRLAVDRSGLLVPARARLHSGR